MVGNHGQRDCAHLRHIQCVGGIISHAKIVFEQSHYAVNGALVAATADVEHVAAALQAEAVLGEPVGRPLANHHVASLSLAINNLDGGAADALHKILQQFGSLKVNRI